MVVYPGPTRSGCSDTEFNGFAGSRSGVGISAEVVLSRATSSARRLICESAHPDGGDAADFLWPRASN